MRKAIPSLTGKRPLISIGHVNQDLGCLRSSMRHRHVEAMGIWREEASTSARGRRRSSDAVVMIRITLSKNLHRTFTTYDIDLSPNGVIEDVVVITHRRQCKYDSPRIRVQNN